MITITRTLPSAVLPTEVTAHSGRYAGELDLVRDPGRSDDQDQNHRRGAGPRFGEHRHHDRFLPREEVSTLV